MPAFGLVPSVTKVLTPTLGSSVINLLPMDSMTRVFSSLATLATSIAGRSMPWISFPRVLSRPPP